jgi:hypothetical protein
MFFAHLGQAAAELLGTEQFSTDDGLSTSASVAVNDDVEVTVSAAKPVNRSAVQPSKDGALPFGWAAHLDDEDNVYYENTTTGESQWERPRSQTSSEWSTPGVLSISALHRASGLGLSAESSARAGVNASAWATEKFLRWPGSSASVSLSAAPSKHDRKLCNAVSHCEAYRTFSAPSALDRWFESVELAAGARAWHNENGRGAKRIELSHACTIRPWSCFAFPPLWDVSVGAAVSLAEKRQGGASVAEGADTKARNDVTDQADLLERGLVPSNPASPDLSALSPRGRERARARAASSMNMIVEPQTVSSTARIEWALQARSAKEFCACLRSGKGDGEVAVSISVAPADGLSLAASCTIAPRALNLSATSGKSRAVIDGASHFFVDASVGGRWRDLRFRTGTDGVCRARLDCTVSEAVRAIFVAQASPLQSWACGDVGWRWGLQIEHGNGGVSTLH